MKIEEAVKKVKEQAKAKFDETIEVHVNLGIDVKDSMQNIRGVFVFPYPFGKKKIVAAIVTPENIERAKKAGAQIAGSEEIIDTIKNTGKIEFDVLVAEPAMMPKIAPIAKILGPKGLMPNPKNETLTLDFEKAIQELSKGKTNFKNDSFGIIHLSIGKKSMEDQKLIENFNAFTEKLKEVKPEKMKGDFMTKITVCSTMGKGIPVNVK